jgi:hypothetical protein
MQRIAVAALCALFLRDIFPGTDANAAPAMRTRQVPQQSDEDRKRIAEYLAQCLTDWDAGTHMTKKEWARVCQRVVDSRARFRVEQGLGIPDLRKPR